MNAEAGRPQAAAADAADDDRLILSFAAWEGPLDLLLALARSRRIDLALIPIGALVDQYLAYLAAARSLKLEIAADYLVMAAWLAYLKSALLLPAEERPDPDPEEMAARLRWRLRRLEAMRTAGERLMAGTITGIHVLRRGRPEGLRRIRESRWDCDLDMLIAAYAGLNAKPAATGWTPPPRTDIMDLEQALERLSALLGAMPGWMELRRFLPAGASAAAQRSALASSFVAALELVRLGRAEMLQDECFGPLLLRPSERFSP